MKLLCVFSVLCGLVFPALALDREAFTFTKYDLDVRVEPEQQRLAVRGKLWLRNDSPSAQRNLVLQISSTLAWRSIKIAGNPVEFTSHDYTSDMDHTGTLSEAVVTLPREIAPGGTVEVEIGYEGTVTMDATRLTRIGIPEEKAKHTDWDQISKSFSAVRGIGFVTWYPVATEAAGLSEGDSVSETVGRWKEKETDASMKLKVGRTGEGSVSPARCNGEGGVGLYEQMGRAYSVTTDCSYFPLRSKIPVFVIGNYSAIDRAPVNISYLPGQEEAAKTYADAVGEIDEAIPVVGGGAKGLQILGLPDPDAASFVTDGMLVCPLKLPLTNETMLSLAYAKARSMVSSPRAWIQEGLAHYAQAAFIEDEVGRKAALDYLSAHATTLVEAEKAAAGKDGAGNWQAAHSLINAADGLYLQTKAMYVWWMLRDMLGKLPGEALQNYHVADDKDAAYLLRLIEKSTHRDLEWFFDDWVYRDRGLPDFRVDSVYPREIVGGGYMVTVTVENLGEAGAEVPVTLRMPSGDVTRRLEVRGKSKASLRVATSALPQEVVVNDGSVPEGDVSNNRYKIEGR
jgi:hypothetical protein